MLTRAMVFVAAGLAACLALPAQAVVVNYAFPITVSQEVPAPTIVGLEPAGVGFVNFDTDTNMLSWTIHYAGLTGLAVAGHFHGPAPIGVTAGVQVPLFAAAQPASGTLMSNSLLTNTQESELLAGLWYVNLHTAMNPAGEIRGQVIPEPATVGLLALGGVLVVATYRRR